MRLRTAVISIVAIVLLNIPIQWLILRLDLTQDRRYTLSDATCHLLRQLDEPLEVSLLMDGELNSGFLRLKKATEETVHEMHYQSRYVRLTNTDRTGEGLGLSPTVIHERARDGRTIQTTIYPYARLRYHGHSLTVNLLLNQRGLSGEENLNRSIEALEYTLAEAIHSLTQTETRSIAFLEGHGELDEHEVYDLQRELSRYFQIDRGQLSNQAGVLDHYRCVIIADPQEPFSEADKYILDQYLMQGGTLLWLVNGVRFSQDMLATNGITPIIPLDLRLTDMLFRYGVRINPVLVQDIQCLPIPVDVSTDSSQPNWQPMPWTYAPLLLTSDASPITRGVSQVMSTFASSVEWVGGDDGLKKDILLATSTASTATGAPAEVDLSDLTIDRSRFGYAYIPVATSLEGVFPSLFAHRLPPEEIVNASTTRTTSSPTRQVVVACGNVARNDWQQGQALPVGYDRYTQTQYGNRDFLVNAVLYLTDDSGLIQLRQKSVALRLLNDRRAHDLLTGCTILSILIPILLVAGIGLTISVVRRKKYIIS